MNERQELFLCRRRHPRIKPEYSVELLRPGHLSGPEIAIKASDLGEALGAIEIVSAAAKLVFRDLHPSDVDVQRRDAAILHPTQGDHHVAAVGQRLIGTVTRLLIAQFFAALDRRIAPRAGPAMPRWLAMLRTLLRRRP